MGNVINAKIVSRGGNSVILRLEEVAERDYRVILTRNDGMYINEWHRNDITSASELYSKIIEALDYVPLKDINNFF